MTKLRAGVIGLGVGERHAAAYDGLGDCDLVALCDFNEERLEAARLRWPAAEHTRNAKDLIEDSSIDLLSIASYDNYHFEQADAALKLGKHVFVEKPVCLHADEASRLRGRLAERPNLRLSSNHILRRCPRFRALKRRIDKGRLGRVFHLDGEYCYGRRHKITHGWRSRMEHYSAVCGAAIHIVDLFLWFVGERVTEVAAFGNDIATRGTEFRYNGCVTSILRFEGGATANVTANLACVRPHFHGVSVYGTAATFVNGPDYGRLFTSSDEAVEPERLIDAYPASDKGELAAAFAGAVLSGNAPEVSADEVFDAVSVCFAMDEASRTGQTTLVRYA